MDPLGYAVWSSGDPGNMAGGTRGGRILEPSLAWRSLGTPLGHLGGSAHASLDPGKPKLT